MSLSRLIRCCLFCCLLLLSGCGAEESPELIQYRRQFLKTQKPDGALSIEEARQSAQENKKLTLSVRVGTKDIEQWWSPNKAAMVVSEGLPGSHYNLAEGHDPESCPFCRWKWKVEDAAAFVEFRDKDGEIIPYDCGAMFGIKENDHVVVSGEGTLNDEGFLELVADGIYIVDQQSD